MCVLYSWVRWPLPVPGDRVDMGVWITRKFRQGLYAASYDASGVRRGKCNQVRLSPGHTRNGYARGVSRNARGVCDHCHSAPLRSVTQGRLAMFVLTLSLDALSAVARPDV